jgi:hypothetical protein
MRFDLQKIDERIKKLQEIRRLATDPEAASLLLEFMTPSSEPSIAPEPAPSTTPDHVRVGVHPVDARELVKDVVTAKEAGSGGGLWTRTRG